VSKHFGRIALAVLVALALGLGLTAFAGSATAASSSSACSSEHAKVVSAKRHVAKDKKALKKAQRHHHTKAAKKAKRHLKRDRRKLARAKAAYQGCLNRQHAPAPAPTPTPTPSNPVTDQCNATAAQITSQDPSGQLATGSAAFCDLLGQLAASSGGDPTTLCTQLAAQDPTGQFGQICTALGTSALPALPGTSGLPTGDGGVVGSTLESTCDQIAVQDPTGQLSQLCTGLGSLPL
jgi:hypothetical protein